ncbi:MAG: lysozyme [Rickettsiales bacterium]
MRRITSNGLQLIKRFEGFSSTIYLDVADLPTIGYGHLIKPHEKHLYKNGITETEAIALLKQDIALAEHAVIRLINVPLNNNQFDALVSFTFNLGAGTLQRSTLRAKLNKQEYWAAPREFMRWIYAEGQKVPGLIIRRMAEVELYSSL